ncbi:MAG TPA: hypothetical protein VGM76_11100 [Lacipirellulaceae bacterium]|jgi:hypothetical protein
MADRLSILRHSRWTVGQVFLWIAAPALSLLSTAALAANTDFSTAPTWQPPTAEAVSRQLDGYLRSSGVSPEKQQSIRDLWSNTASATESPDLLDRLAPALARADDRVAQLIAFCARVDRPAKLPDFSWLADSQTPSLVRFNMRLYYSRWLAENNYDDEAISWTDGMSLTDVVSPDALLFYRAIANHRLVHADQADIVLAQLLERPEDLPVRYQKLAVLMQKDLASLDDESLDHIARRMSDVRRRLELGRTGKTVQGVENGVIDSLDKIIKKAEDQAQQQAQAAAASGSQQSSTPMQDSHLAELKAPGKVDRRDVGHGADWGNMNDKDREQALQEIGREFPSHYREVIEEYFRQLATEPGDQNVDGSGK